MGNEKEKKKVEDPQKKIKAESKNKLMAMNA